LAELKIIPRPSNWIYGILLLRGGEGKGREGMPEGREKRRVEVKGKGKIGGDWPPFLKS